MASNLLNAGGKATTFRPPSLLPLSSTPKAPPLFSFYTALTSVPHLLLVLCLALTGPTTTEASPFPESIREQLRTRIEAAQQEHRSALEINDTPLLTADLLTEFYERRGFQPTWVHSEEPDAQVEQLLTHLQNSKSHGLRPADYRAEEIESFAQALRLHEQSSDAKIRHLVDLELLCTNAFLLYGSHLLVGRLDPKTITPSWTLNQRDSDLLSVLEEAGRSRSIETALKRLPPQQPEYDALVQALERYRRIARQGGWPILSEGPTLKRGVEGERVETLRERLRATGDLPVENPATATFDESMREAVLHFQARHGLETDGVVGSATRQALNVSPQHRIRQMEVNLERWRWLPQDLGERYVLVNIAAFHLWVVERDEKVMNMRVVTGRPYRQTPVFSDQISYLVFSPYWHVPHSLATRDLLPNFKKDPSLVRKQNFEILQGWGAETRVIDPRTVDWNRLSVDRFPYRLRQGPSPQNALGQVKFMFPNAHNVYLHDTPTRTHFSQADRSFSSGCIRLERPLDLAEYLLKDTEGWSRQRIEQSVGRDREVTAVLDQSVPVHLLYWTAWAETDGTVHFRNDVYQRDSNVESALAAPLPDQDENR